MITLIWMNLPILFLKMENRTGANIEPCGAPFLNLKLSTWTLCVLSVLFLFCLPLYQGSFAEVRVYSLGLFAVVSCLKRENYTVPTRGLSLKLPMDPRICLNYLPGSFTAPVMAQIMVWRWYDHYPSASHLTFNTAVIFPQLICYVLRGCLGLRSG